MHRLKSVLLKRLGVGALKIAHTWVTRMGNFFVFGANARRKKDRKEKERGARCIVPLQVVGGAAAVQGAGNGTYLAVAEVLDVAVGAEADVVGEVEAVVVRVFVDYDLVSAPVPVVAEAIVGGENVEVEAAEPEAFAIAAFDAPDVAAAETACEAAVIPGMIDMVVDVSATGVVTDPLAVGVDVRRVGVAFPVVERAVLVGLASGSVMHGWRAMLGRTRRRSFVPFLRKSRNGTDERECEYAEK